MGDPKQSYSWFTTDPPGNAIQLEDEGLQPGQGDENILWITDSRSKERRTLLDIPMGVWTRLELMPMDDGEMITYCRYPTGSEDQLLDGYVEKGHIYKAWYHTEAEGKHEIWYTMGGSKSNAIQFDVQSDLDGKKAMVPPNTIMRSGMPIVASFPAISSMSVPNIGLSAGGAKDVSNFRENIENGYLPLPTDITYEGLFYDYYFDIGRIKECPKLFCPSYSHAISKDLFSSEVQYYLSIGLDSGIKDFHRRKLNLVVVLDYSGSMSSGFDQYYYNRFGNQQFVSKEKDSNMTKMQIAGEAVAGLLDHLRSDDRFGLVVFSDDAFLVDPLTPVGDKDLGKLTKRILGIKERGGTNMEAGMRRGTELFKKLALNRLAASNQAEYENRIIFLTDAMPNIGETGEWDLKRLLKENSDSEIYTTFIGIGVDFNTELTDYISKIRGSNYYSVHSASEFRKRMEDEFDFMVTPLVFDLRLTLNATGYRIEKVYGAPEAGEDTGDILKIGTLFPSKMEAGKVRGGIILVKLKKLSPQSSLDLRICYSDQSGEEESDVEHIDLQDERLDFYQNTGIRKAVLLAKYADLLKNWIIDERVASKKSRRLVPSVTLESGIVVPIELGKWERQSMPLDVSEPYPQLFAKFGAYFEKEMEAIGDNGLKQEQLILEKLSLT